MISVIKTGTLFGLDIVPIEVEVDITAGLPGVTIVGLPDKAVEEAKERVRSAINNSGFILPARKTIINLAPADIRKEGAGFDLPIAIGTLCANGIIPKEALKDSWFIGELALSGELRHVPGILPFAKKAKKQKIKNIYLPTIDAQEAAVISDIKIYPTDNLRTLVDHLLGNARIHPAKYIEDQQTTIYEYDFAYVKGQEHAKRALEIAAAGGHNVLLTGPPGSGKTLLSRCMPSILPPMTEEEKIEVSSIYSAAGLLQRGLIKERPFRAPHHTTSNIALIGGGSIPRPGEVTLSHLGVLFLDEVSEFPRSVLEVLRQPLEDGYVTISRAQGTIRFPASFSLIPASNPCPCGYATDQKRQCICTPHQLITYQKKLSGPLLDRIDMQIEVPRVSSESLSEEVVSKPSIEIRKRVINAREIQSKRFKNQLINNADMSVKQIKNLINISDDNKKLLREAVDKLHLSARSYYRIIKLARTIADLANSSEIKNTHIAEAVQYRPQKSTSIIS